MKCDKCDSEITVYDLYQRSYRLYIYMCKTCKNGFLAHHFDTKLEIYQLDEVSMKRSEKLIFLTGLKAEPRIFDFKLERDLDSIIVADEEIALGELVKNKEYMFALYSKKAIKRLCRILGCESEREINSIKDKIIGEWEASK